MRQVDSSIVFSLCKGTKLFVLTILLAGCASTHNPHLSTQTLVDVESLSASASSSSQSKTDFIRTEGLQNTALSLGAQAGLSWRSRQINAELEPNTKTLDQIFNFNALILDHSVLPPVLVEGDNNLNIADSTTIRVADVSYKIVQQAQFVTAAPTWRNYIWLDYPPPEVPHQTLLPKNHAEQLIWQRYVQLGWVKGIQQANAIYDENLGKLKRDYVGMVLYRKLLAQHMVTPPYVAKTELGVTGGGSELSINDQVLRITALPQLQNDTTQWNAVVRQ